MVDFTLIKGRFSYVIKEKEEQFDDPLTVQINKYADRCINNSCIDPNLYDKFDVKAVLFVIEIQVRVFLPV